MSVSHRCRSHLRKVAASGLLAGGLLFSWGCTSEDSPAQLVGESMDADSVAAAGPRGMQSDVVTARGQSTLADIRALLVVDPNGTISTPVDASEFSQRASGGVLGLDEFVEVAQSLTGVDAIPLSVYHDPSTQLTAVRRAENEAMAIAAGVHSDLPLGPMEEDALALYAALGGHPDEVTMSSGVLRVIADEPEREVYSYVAAYKVHIVRRLAGIQVRGDYLHVTFALDGSFRKLLAKWLPIEYGSVVLPPQRDDDEFLDHAAEQLVYAGVSLPPTVVRIEVGVQFHHPELSESDDGAVGAPRPVVLRGYAKIRDMNGNGAGSEGKIPVKYFSLFDEVLEPPSDQPGEGSSGGGSANQDSGDEEGEDGQ